MFAKFHMYLDQHEGGGKYGKSAPVTATMAVPFRRWKAGYVLVSSRSDDTEEWMIQIIDSADKEIHRENCTVTLINKAGEIRTIKGASLYSGYVYKSPGDQPEPETEQRSDVKPLAISPAGVREFYPRNKGEGTRILMLDKTSYIVAEGFDEVWNKLASIGAPLVRSGDHGILDTSLVHGN